jgi:hypothetical protein
LSQPCVDCGRNNCSKNIEKQKKNLWISKKESPSNNNILFY